MPVFVYVAKDKTGKIHRGRAEADNEKALSKRLEDSGYWVSQVTRDEASMKKKKGIAFFGRVKPDHLSIFCRQFSTMINAGVSLVRCLQVLETQTPNERLKGITRDLINRVEGGETLSRSLSHHSVFSPLFIGLVRAGEVGGVLDETLERLSVFLEADSKLKRKVKAAMTYPVLVMIVAFLIVTGLVVFIVPKFIDIFKDFGNVQMPMITQILIDISAFTTSKQGATILIVGGFGSIIAWKKFKSTKFGKRVYDKYKLKVPVFGKLSHNIAVARFTRTLGTLLSSGVPILQAMETVAGAVDNETFYETIMKCRARVREGDSIGDPLAKSGLFPPMVVQMVSIGEETGALDQMLDKVADFYEIEVEAQLQSLSAALEPIMIVVLGVIVGFIVIALFMPMIALISSLEK
ncbi:MAG: type II secretion system F family protein [Abditibacteriaceae bacterium]